MAERLDIEKIKSELKDTNYEVDYATPCGDSALFLPSISSLYAKHVSKKDETIRGGNLPENMKTIKDLNILDPQAGIFWYPWALYSAGHAQLDLSKTDIQEEIIQQRDRNRTFILGDSGGFQLSTGVLKGYMGDLDNMEIDDKSLRHKIMKWLEHTADFSMILDIPTTSCKKENSFIYKKYNQLGDKGMFYKCLEYTVKNNAYFIKHRVPGKTKFLNVLQGRDSNDLGTGENDIWYSVVKYFNNKDRCLRDVKEAYNEVIEIYNAYQTPDKKIGLFEIVDGDEIPFGDRTFEGWAIPGNLKFDFPMLMSRFKTMHDEGYFEDTGETLLIHFLGISRISAGLLYTTLQNEMRKTINSNMIITYDAASPFVCTAKGKGYGTYTVTNQKMTYKMDTLPDRKFEMRSEEIAKQEKDKQARSETTFDSIFAPEVEIETIDPNTIPLTFSKSQKLWHCLEPRPNYKNRTIGHKTSCTTINEDNKKIDIIEETTLGKRLVVGDICYKTWDAETSSFWDGTSYVFIMNMNVEQHIRAIQLAHKYWRLPLTKMYNHLPRNIIDGRLLIEEIIRNKFDDEVMKKDMKRLKKILGMSAEKPDGDEQLLMDLDEQEQEEEFLEGLDNGSDNS